MASVLCAAQLVRDNAVGMMCLSHAPNRNSSSHCPLLRCNLLRSCLRGRGRTVFCAWRRRPPPPPPTYTLPPSVPWWSAKRCGSRTSSRDSAHAHARASARTCAFPSLPTPVCCPTLIDFHYLDAFSPPPPALCSKLCQLPEELLAPFTVVQLDMELARTWEVCLGSDDSPAAPNRFRDQGPASSLSPLPA